MKRTYFVSLFLCLTTSLLSQSNPVSLTHQTARVASPISASQPDPQAQARILDGYGKLPLSFETNQGQTDARVKFLSRTGGYTLFLTGDEAVLAWNGKKAKRASPHGPKPASLTGWSGVAEALPFPKTVVEKSSAKTAPASDRATGGVVRMKLRNANPAARVTGLDELAGTRNYFIGNDPKKWRSNVPTYAKVKYEGIYSGIDLVYYGNQRQLEYDFIVAPGADPHRIVFEVRGAKRIRQDEHGDLVLKMKTGEDEIRWHKPVVYQEKNGARQEIAAHYAITDTNRVGFEVAKYDPSKPLYIDPLIYSTYLGGSLADAGYGIAVDSAGNAYVTGATCSTDFPTMNPLQPAQGGACSVPDDLTSGDAFVTKINPTGSALVYSTYLGGILDDMGDGIAVDSAGNAYVVGSTSSADFPVTVGAFQTTFGGGRNAFVAKINAQGSALIYSTYLGGSTGDDGFGIAVDSAGNAYVTGGATSTDFPVTPGAYQKANGGGWDVFVSKINPTGSALTYSTYLGGSGEEISNGIAVDSAGNAYVTGYTDSYDFPTMNPIQRFNMGFDAFVSKINATGSALGYSTYLGGSQTDGGTGIAVDSAGDAYISGFTASPNFPTKNPLQGANAGAYDAFVCKINATGSALLYSTYLGGSGWELGNAIAVDSAGNVYVTGFTGSTDYPTTMNAVQPVNGGGDKAFVSKLDPTGSALVYASYLGGSGGDEGSAIAVGRAGKVYVTGHTWSTDFPTMNPLQPTNAGGADAFVTKTSAPSETLTTTTLSSSPNPSIYGQAVTFTAAVTSSVGAPPDGETVTFMEGTTTLGTGALSGGSASLTTSALALAAGTHYIKAVYGGDSKFLGSKSNTLSQVVNKATSTTSLASSRNPSNSGQSVTFTASVAPQFSGTPTGKVTFRNGATVLATKALNSGTASFTKSNLPLGSNMITAVYGGDSNFASSTSAPVNQFVLATTTIALSSSLNPSIYGQAVTFTAAVTSTIGAPPDGEIVSFMKGTFVLGIGTLSGGAASFTTSTLNAGTNLIQAVYVGDSTFAPSRSKAVSQVVNKATTTTTLTSSQNPSTFGQSVIFTASVSPQFSGTVKGAVTFYDGTTALKTASLSAGAAKFITSTLAKGTHSITATYNGSTSFTGSSASLTQTVN